MPAPPKATGRKVVRLDAPPPARRLAAAHVPHPPARMHIAAALVPPAPLLVPGQLVVPTPPGSSGFRELVVVPAPPGDLGDFRVRRLVNPSRFMVGVVRWAALFLALWVIVPTAVLQWEPIAIIGESMSPMIRAGDVVMADPEMVPGQGAVVTYENPQHGLITHRVVGWTDDGDLRLRGDANGSEDPAVREDEVVGVARLLVPVAALPVSWLKNGNLIAAVLSLVLVAIVVSGKMNQAVGLLRRQATTAGPLLLILVTVAVMVPSQALLTGTTDNAGNSFGVHDPPPATGVTANCTQLGALYNVAIDWTPSTSFYADGQLVQRQINGGGFTTIATFAENTTGSHADDGNTTLGTYDYRIVTTTPSALTATSATDSFTATLVGC